MTDKAYVKAIDSLIPKAEVLAGRQMARKRVKRNDRAAVWNNLFHGAMNRLAREAGLRRMAFEV